MEVGLNILRPARNYVYNLIKTNGNSSHHCVNVLPLITDFKMIDDAFACKG